MHCSVRLIFLLVLFCEITLVFANCQSMSLVANNESCSFVSTNLQNNVLNKALGFDDAVKIVDIQYGSDTMAIPGIGVVHDGILDFNDTTHMFFYTNGSFNGMVVKLNY